MQTLPAPVRIEERTTTRHAALALLSLAAAAIHFAAIEDHADVHFLHGLFFAVLAWSQALWAAWVYVGAPRQVVAAGLVGNLAVIVVWAVSRTTGLPVPPDPWTAEDVGTADVTATVLELAIVAGCAMVLLGRTELAARYIGRGPALSLALAVVVAASVAIAVGSHSHSGSAAHGHGSGDHGHVSIVAPGELDQAQIDMIRAAMSQYEDVEVARAEGWESEHADFPETGSHFYREGDWSGPYPARTEVDLLDPEFLMYSKFLTGEWELIAVAYVASMELYEEPPTALSGAEYHQHVWTCVVDGEELEEDEFGPISELECEVRGGIWSPGGVWMTHVWFIDNPNGVFAETNPVLVPRGL